MYSNGTLKENHHLALLCASGNITRGFNVQNVEAVDAELKRRAVNGEKTKGVRNRIRQLQRETVPAPFIVWRTEAPAPHTRTIPI
jgi:hypothetical protein